MVVAEPGGCGGTTIYDPAKTYNSFVLFAGGDNVSRLIDLNGKVVHEWKFGGQPVAYLDPALAGGAKGHVFVTLETEEGKGTDLVPGRAQTRVVKTVGEVDWNESVARRSRFWLSRAWRSRAIEVDIAIWTIDLAKIGCWG